MALRNLQIRLVLAPQIICHGIRDVVSEWPQLVHQIFRCKDGVLKLTRIDSINGDDSKKASLAVFGDLAVGYLIKEAFDQTGHVHVFLDRRVVSQLHFDLGQSGKLLIQNRLPLAVRCGQRLHLRTVQLTRVVLPVINSAVQLNQTRLVD